MKCYLRTVAPALLSLLLVIACAPWLNAQITGNIQAHIDHSFVIGNTTLPPGDYTFQMLRNSDLQVMTVTNDNDRTSVNFLVRTTVDDHTPRHSELLFRKYGDTEFLSKIFETGSKPGEEVTETSRAEEHFAQQGLHPMEHTEEQK